MSARGEKTNQMKWTEVKKAHRQECLHRARSAIARMWSTAIFRRFTDEAECKLITGFYDRTPRPKLNKKTISNNENTQKSAQNKTVIYAIDNDR